MATPLSRWRPRSADFDADPALEYDFTLFHACPGAWHSVEQMRACLSEPEWLLHAAWLRRKQAAEDAALKRASR